MWSTAVMNVQFQLVFWGVFFQIFLEILNDFWPIYIFVFHLKLKPIFHQKPCSRWLPNENEIDTNNMKSTWLTQAPTRGYPTRPILHLLALGSHWARRGRRGFSDTNMLVSETRIACIVSGPQREWFRVAVEYRLNPIYFAHHGFSLSCLFCRFNLFIIIVYYNSNQSFVKKEPLS